MALAALLLAAAPAWAGGRAARVVEAALPGEMLTAPDGSSDAERFAFAPALVPALLAAPPEAELRLRGWPAAPGERVEAIVERHEVYAPEARIWAVRRGRLVEVPRSRLRFFWGHAAEDPEVRIFAALDPESGEVEGFAESPRGTYEVRPERQGRYLVAAAAAFRDDREPPLDWSCGEEELPRRLVALGDEQKATPLFAAAMSTLHTATVAVDTDNELLSQKFGNDTTAATDYVAQLVAAMNVVYERDLLVRLVQGTTFLRLSPDPYPSTSATDMVTKLNEFTNYWRANFGGVTRAAAMMLSGKSPSANSAAGIAWVDALCSTQTGYSFTQVFKFAGSTASNDLRIVAHEIGHNFGSPHTHCYSPPIDQCYAAETACYAGATSCPAPTTINGVSNVRGTLMSYCHLLGGCSAANVFHSRSVDLLTPKIAARVGQCVFPAAVSPTVSAISPVSGSTAGGTPVTITGSNFIAGATVSIGGVPATAVNVLSPTVLTAVTGAHATGTFGVTVTNPGNQAGTLSNAYFYSPPPAPADFYTLAPCRRVDTRTGNGGAIASGARRTFAITGGCGVPTTAQAVAVNVTVVAPPASGFLALYPGNAIPLGTSTINFTAGRTRANNAVLRLATDGAGTLAVHNAAPAATDLVIDISGYFQ